MSYDYSLFRAPGPGPMSSWEAAPPPPLGTSEELKQSLSSLFPGASWTKSEGTELGQSQPSSGAGVEFQITPDEDGLCRFLTVRRITRAELADLCRALGVVAVDSQKMELIRGVTARKEGLEPGLRAPWSLCETVRADLLTTLEAVPPGHWARQPGHGRWSVAQQADHLLKAEVGTSKIVRRLIRGDYQGLTRPAGAVLHDSRLETYPFGPVAAPPALQPDGLDAGEAQAQLAAAHARFFEELQRFAAGDPDAIVAPDPASDLWFTLAGWVRVQALHEAHHILQIKALMRGSSA